MFAVEDRGSTLHAPPRLVGTRGDRPAAADGGALVSRLPLDESPSRRPGPAGLPAGTAQPRPRDVLPRSRPSGGSRSAVRLHHPACSAGAVERNRTASEATSTRHPRVRIRTFSAVTSRSPPRDLCGGQWTLLLGEPQGRAARCPPAYPWQPANRLAFRRMSRCPFPVRTPSRPWIRSARGRCPGPAGDSPWCMCSPPLGRRSGRGGAILRPAPTRGLPAVGRTDAGPAKPIGNRLSTEERSAPKKGARSRNAAPSVTVGIVQ